MSNPYIITGTWRGIIDRSTGKDGKRTFITGLLETDSKYNNQIPMAMVGECAEYCQSIRPGATVQCEFKIGGREWKGKYFPEIRCVAMLVDDPDPRPTHREPPKTERQPAPQSPPAEPALPTVDDIPF